MGSLKRFTYILVMVVFTAGLLACRLTPATQPTSPPAPPKPSQAPAESTATPPATPAARSLPAIAAETGVRFSPMPLPKAGSGRYAGLEIRLPLDLEKIANPRVIDGLTEAQRMRLKLDGFTVLQTQDEQFTDILEEVAIHTGQPYYLTTDAAYHALHLTFDELLKALEKEHLRPQMTALTRALLDETRSYARQVAGSPLEADATLAADYLAVALRLFDPQARFDSATEQRIAPQLAQIDAGAGRSDSALIPGFEDDYGAYKPVGHYDGDPELESYFRGMTWFGRVQFFFQRPGRPELKPSRAPLLITFALRRARVGAEPAHQAWARIAELLAFMIGPSDDPGPAELAPLMDAVFGPSHGLRGLGDDAAWQAFISRSGELPAPQINSTFAVSLGDLQTERGWRFMGQRFALDAYVLQNLVFDRVGTMDHRREKPSGLDVAAALGSPAALAALEATGDTSYAGYPEQLAKLRQAVTAMTEDEWLNRFYSGWLFAFTAQVLPKGEAFPAPMRSEAWVYKDMNSMLGSWTELKHDTALYTKMPESAGGGGPPSSGPAPVYVEPQPDVFYRLAWLSQVLADGLAARGYEALAGVGSEPGPLTFAQLSGSLHSLGERFSLLGDVAIKELRGEDLSEDERWALQTCLGPVECMVLRSRLYGEEQQMPPIPITAVVSGAGEKEVLQAAVGNLDRIFVIVPINGRLEVAQGGVFSYYEFTRLRDERMTDADWRLELALRPPTRPEWVQQISLPGGETTTATAFRLGDTYLITPAGANLNLRAAPSTQANVLKKLQPENYVTLLEGPLQAEKHTWWRVRVEPMEELTGWVVEDPVWYERAYGQ